MVVDGRTNLTAPDHELARLLLRLGKPLFLAVNKIDTNKQQAWVNEFHRLGIRRMFPISSEHGRGLDELLDAVFETLPPQQLTTVGMEDTEDTGDHAETPREPKSRSLAIPMLESRHCSIA